jgi:hypothetical protein
MLRSIRTRTAGALLAFALAGGALAPVAAAQQDLRMPDTRDVAGNYHPTLQAEPASSTGGFDWLSAAIGAAAGTGTAIVAVAFGGGVRRLRPVSPRP